MSLWLILGLVYWIGCCTVAVGLMMFCTDDSDTRRWQQLKQLARERTLVFLTCAAMGLLFLALVSPFALPYALIRGYLEIRRENAYFKRLLRTHREFIFDPVHPVNLPKPARMYFDEGSRVLERLGFTAVGDYRMKEEPPDYFGRCFLSADGRIQCTLMNIFAEQNYSFSTMFSGGQMLETTSGECHPGMEWLREHELFRGDFVADEPLEEGLQAHRRAIADFSRRYGILPLEFEPDAVLQFIEYEGRLFSRLLYERGERDEPPPEPELPPHRVADPLDADKDGISSPRGVASLEPVGG